MSLRLRCRSVSAWFSIGEKKSGSMSDRGRSPPTRPQLSAERVLQLCGPLLNGLQISFRLAQFASFGRMSLPPQRTETRASLSPAGAGGDVSPGGGRRVSLTPRKVLDGTFVATELPGIGCRPVIDLLLSLAQVSQLVLGGSATVRSVCGSWRTVTSRVPRKQAAYETFDRVLPSRSDVDAEDLDARRRDFQKIRSDSEDAGVELDGLSTPVELLIRYGRVFVRPFLSRAFVDQNLGYISRSRGRILKCTDSFVCVVTLQ